MCEIRPKTLLLLGGSYQQVVAIETAKRLGFHTVLCDYLPDNPGQFVADEYYPTSTTNRAAVLEVAEEVHADGVLAYASDPAASTAAYIAEVLGLPTNPLSSVDILSTKYLFRDHLAEHGFACPKNVAFPESTTLGRLQLDLADLSYPLLIKPTDASGSKGVTLIADQSGLELAIGYAAGFSRNNILIAEECIEYAFPHLIGGDIFVVDGEVRFWGLMSCLRDMEGNGLIPVGKKFPSGLSPNQIEAAKNAIQRLIDSLRIRFGEFNVELIVGKDNAVYILELGARAGGNMIPLELSDISGIDLVSANVLCALGEYPGDIRFDGTDVSYYSTYVLHSNNRGIIKEISLDDEITSHLYRSVLYRSPGEEVMPFDGADKAVGILFMHFDDEVQMDEILANIDEHAEVVLEPSYLSQDIDSDEMRTIG